MNVARRVALSVACAAVAACTDATSTPEARLSVLETLSGADTSGYERATSPRPFEFPADHGSHPGFRTEWWYVTGNLTSTSGRDFGFQFTIFRSALTPFAPASPSAWATNQAYMAHFAVTDVSTERFHAFERFSRGALDLAGASAGPFRVWLDRWTIEGTSATTFPLRLRAADGDIGLDLTLDSGKPAVANGDGGVSQKGPEPGNASYYYSFTRMPAAGRLVLGSDTLSVSGLAWFDREWSTSALSEDLVGWDWFALQLDDGWDLMLYRLRRSDGSADTWSEGTLVDPRGNATRLAWGTDVTMESTSTWTSPIDGAVYPSEWRVDLPTRGWNLTLVPLIPDQELDLTFRYWEGAVSIRGTGEGGRTIQGRGYVELTGYAGATPAR